MATVTPNFNWPVPTSTDLVKDGATAIEALGDSIDASLVDLKGGTTGQVLSKNSNTDMDFVWVTDAAGDITGVTAGTGISGGGTSGTVTVTNSMATAIDAKGDLVPGTGADTFARLAVGANGTVLTADSAEATGLKWATAGGGGKVLQVVSTTYSTQTTTTSTSFTDTGLSLSITPTSATSKILVIANLPYNVERTSSIYAFGNFNIMRGATQVWAGNSQLMGGEFGGATYVVFGTNASMHYLDSPSTTSATTYKIQMQNGGTSQTMRAQAASGTSVLTLLEIGA
jgi:hypothetical protein